MTTIIGVEYKDKSVIVAEDDPFIESFKLMDRAGAAQIRILPAVGAEKFAEYVYNKLQEFIDKETEGRVRVVRVESHQPIDNTELQRANVLSVVLASTFLDVQSVGLSYVRPERFSPGDPVIA